jgi:subtilisin
MAKSGRSGFRIPSFHVEQLVVTCSETVDWSLTDFGIPELWPKTTGKGIKVAVLDTGCAMMHPDLKDQILDAEDFTGSKIGPSDTNGHGTHCCGVIAAKRNEVGVVGVAYDAKLLVGKVLNDVGAGSADTIAKGIEWAVSKKANIISMSFGSPSSHPRIKAAVDFAASKNVLLIAAAGNEGPGPLTVGYPANYPSVLAVAAVDPNKKVAKFSSRGPGVDIAAPGVDILSTYPPKNYAKLSGTSMATPFVSGVVALLLAHNIRRGIKTIKTCEDLIKQVKDTSYDAGEAGFDNDYGWGLINPKALVLGTNSSKKINVPTKSKPVRVTFDKSDFNRKGAEKYSQIFGGIKNITFELEPTADKKKSKNA